MEKRTDDRCGYTVGTCLRETMVEFEIWRRAAKKQQLQIRKICALADALSLLWDKLDEPTRNTLDDNVRIRELLRSAMDYYGF